MTAAGFPHSETPGSQPGCRLPGAYRRLQRPSSAPGAKASTVCPKKLGTTHALQQQQLSLRRNRRCSRPLCSSQETDSTSPRPPAPGETGTGPQRRNQPHQAPAPSEPNSVPAPRPPPRPVPGTAPPARTSRGKENAERIASAPQGKHGRQAGHSPADGAWCSLERR
jgi:hypothetical protein